MIPVNRGARGKVMVEVMKRTREEMDAGRQLIIYPEGTRRPPGAAPEYRYGIARIYRDANVPVVPVVAHWGLFWGRRKLVKYPGHFKVRILPAIQPGLDPDAFYKLLVETLEKSSDELLVETVAANPHLPLPPEAKKRLAELKAQTTA
jgi:1-acyl-sn-glycerol-3-phosphate acyltransferase